MSFSAVLLAILSGSHVLHARLSISIIPADSDPAIRQSSRCFRFSVGRYKPFSDRADGAHLDNAGGHGSRSDAYVDGNV